MFIQLSMVAEDENGSIYYKPIFVNTDKVLDFSEDEFTDSFGNTYTFVTVSYGKFWVRVKESMKEISALIGVRLII